MQVLITGGAGYIGSHTIVELLNNNHEAVVIDNLYNSSQKSIKRISKITGKNLEFYKIDLCDKQKLNFLHHALS